MKTPVSQPKNKDPRLSNRVSAGSPNDHLANERTFLAWIRTSIGIMGFGFVVVKFSLFTRQITAAVVTGQLTHTSIESKIVGIVLVVVGALILLLSYLRYEKIKNRLNKGFYYHTSSFNRVVTGVLLFVSIILIVYLSTT
ncbi:YidH family protein [Albibacterium indicum]|uniref:YidH family protein n=1 Tax=Albibacterium indicum TaxID=2292082 RepID=UPI000E549330|nr:DUF202 domain-containing protein [Pedobacter indicus]